MEVSNKQGYTSIEHKKERSMEESDGADEGEEETEDWDDIFEGVKQVDSHVQMMSFEGVVSFELHRRR